MTGGTAPTPASDPDPEETREWLDALEAVIEREGPSAAHFLIEQMLEAGRLSGINLPYSATTEYVNTIPADRQIAAPGDYAIENRIRSYIRWNAMVMVLRANQATRAWAATSPPSLPRRRCMTWASTISGMRPRTPMAATWSYTGPFGAGHVCPPSCSAGSPRSSWTTSARR